MLDVDDLVLGTLPDKMEGLRKKFQSWLRLEKFEINDTTFGGRRLTCESDWMERELHPVTLSKTRRARGSTRGLRSMQHVLILNFNRIQYLLSTDAMSMTFTSMSDVGGVGSMTEELDGSKRAWLLDGILTSQRTVKLSPITWRSAKLKRKVSSTLAGETLGLSHAMVGDTAVRDMTQFIAPVCSAAHTGLSVGAGHVSKPHRRRDDFIRLAAQGVNGHSTRPKERRRGEDRGRLSGQVWRLHQMGTASSDASRRTHQSFVGQDP